MGDSPKALDYVEGKIDFNKVSQETLKKYIENGGLSDTDLEEEFRDYFQEELFKKFKNENRRGHALGILNYSEDIYTRWGSDTNNEVDFVDRNAAALGKRLTSVESYRVQGDSILLFETPEDVAENRYLTIGYEKDIFTLAEKQGLLR